MNKPLLWLIHFPVLLVLLLPDTAAAQTGGKLAATPTFRIKYSFPTVQRPQVG
jgi:hypothetical protein